MDETELRPMVRHAYVALADVLEPLPERGWDQASLCEGWRVREVVAHVTMPVRYDEEQFTAELRACGFDFTRLSNTVAAKDAQLPTSTLVSNLRDRTLHDWTPPGGGVQGAISHAVIHGLDITVALGLDPTASADAIRVVLDGLADGGSQHFGVDVEGMSLEATDLDWRFGNGTAVRAPAAGLVLRLSGRNVPDEVRAVP
jgi:uncharacterized protein (TIGR03083 family)